MKPTFRRQGIGRALLKASEAWAQSQGCTEFATDTLLEDADIAEIYGACGYEEVGQLRCFRKLLDSEKSSDQ